MRVGSSKRRFCSRTSPIGRSEAKSYFGSGSTFGIDHDVDRLADHAMAAVQAEHVAGFEQRRARADNSRASET